MARYVLADLALSDLAEIRHYIAQDNPAAASKVIAGFFQRFQLLAGQPELGPRRSEFAGGDLRIFSVGNYVIFYRAVGSDVEIARVLHGARDIESLFG